MTTNRLITVDQMGLLRHVYLVVDCQVLLYVLLVLCNLRVRFHRAVKRVNSCLSEGRGQILWCLGAVSSAT